MSELTPAISKNARILTIFAVTCTAMVGLVHLFTKDKIALQAQLQLKNQLNGIIKEERHNNEMFLDCIKAPNTKSDLIVDVIYRARLDNQPVAAAIKATAPDGYNGNIDLLIAINNDSSISGVRTLRHNETPGLGDKIELRKSDWITKFTDKRILDENDNRWAVIKDGGMFDQFTGATITPRAVVNTVKKTIDYFELHQAEIFANESNCEAKQ